ncbi:GNAT family N-acetyltransferase [Trinickia sp. YCB016]
MFFKPLDTMETPDLLLRPFTAADAPALFEQMLNDPETMRDLPFVRHVTLDQTAAYIEDAERGWRDGTLIRYALECRKTGQLTGTIELKPALPRIEIGAIISRRGGARRRRAGVFALQDLVDWLIEQPGVFRVFAYCAVDGASHSSMKRLGFVCEGLVKSYEPRPNRGLPAGDSYLFSKTRIAPEMPVPQNDGVAWLHSTLEWQ